MANPEPTYFQRAEYLTGVSNDRLQPFGRINNRPSISINNLTSQEAVLTTRRLVTATLEWRSELPLVEHSTLQGEQSDRGRRFLNMSTNYYKHWAESELGEGTAFIEAVDDVIVRQVEVYGSTFIWCDHFGQSNPRFMLADQPISAIGLTSEHEISAAEFEDMWKKAKAIAPCQ